MFTPKQKVVLEKSIETHGILRQLDKMTEECGELIQAIQKVKYNPTEKNFFSMLYELIDVEIVAAQIKIHYDMTDQEIYKFMVKEKIAHLQQVINHKEKQNDR